MTVVHPNAVSGINSITVQTGNSLSIHKADGSLLRTITGSTGVTTFATASVGTAWTDFSQGGGLNIGLGASISNGSGNVLTFGTNGDDRAIIDASGNLVHGGGSSRSAVGGAQLVQVEGLTAAAGFSAVRNSNDANGPYISLAKSRGTALGAVTVIQDADDLGAIRFGGGDGTDIASEGARIEATVDGTPGSNDIPTRLTFQTTADGAAAPTERLRIDSGGSVTIGDAATHTFAAHSEGDDLVVGGSGWRGMTIYGEGGGGVIQFADDGSNRVGQIMYNHGDNSMIFRVNGNQTRLMIDSSGRLLLGHTSDIGYGFRSQLVGEDGNTSSSSQIRFTASASGPTHVLAKSRNGTAGSKTIVQDDDNLGEIQFRGDDGVDYLSIAASIKAEVDGTPGAGDMPGRLVFSTTADGAESATERLRIDTTGWMGAGQTARDNAGQVAAFKNTSNANSWLSVNVNNNTGIGGVVFGDSDSWAPGYIQYNHTDNKMEFWINAGTRLTINSSGNAIFSGTIDDSLGDVRSIPKLAKTSSYTLVAADVGKCISTNSGVEVPNSVFAAGDAVTIWNDSSSSITITQGSGFQLRKAGETSTGNVTLTNFGLATIWWNTGGTAVITGNLA